MARPIEIVRHIVEMTFEPLDPASCEPNVFCNVFRVSIWGALGTGAIAIISALFKRDVIQQASLKRLSPDVLKASLISSATCAVVAGYITYNLIKSDAARDEIAANRKLIYLEKAGVISSAIGTGAAIIARDFLNSPQSVKGLADYSLQPLFWIGVTTLALKLFHTSQKIKKVSHDKIV